MVSTLDSSLQVYYSNVFSYLSDINARFIFKTVQKQGDLKGFYTSETSELLEWQKSLLSRPIQRRLNRLHRYPK